MTLSEYKEQRASLLNQLVELDARFKGISSSTNAGGGIVYIQCIPTELNTHVVWDSDKYFYLNRIDWYYYYGEAVPRPCLQKNIDNRDYIYLNPNNSYPNNNKTELSGSVYSLCISAFMPLFLFLEK